jgi:hypothetical protein
MSAACACARPRAYLSSYSALPRSDGCQVFHDAVDVTVSCPAPAVADVLGNAVTSTFTWGSQGGLFPPVVLNASLNVVDNAMRKFTWSVIEVCPYHNVAMIVRITIT